MLLCTYSSTSIHILTLSNKLKDSFIAMLYSYATHTVDNTYKNTFRWYFVNNQKYSHICFAERKRQKEGVWCVWLPVRCKTTLRYQISCCYFLPANFCYALVTFVIRRFRWMLKIILYVHRFSEFSKLQLVPSLFSGSGWLMLLLYWFISSIKQKSINNKNISSFSTPYTVLWRWWEKKENTVKEHLPSTCVLIECLPLLDLSIGYFHLLLNLPVLWGPMQYSLGCTAPFSQGSYIFSLPPGMEAIFILITEREMSEDDEVSYWFSLLESTYLLLHVMSGIHFRTLVFKLGFQIKKYIFHTFQINFIKKFNTFSTSLPLVHS